MGQSTYRVTKQFTPEEYNFTTIAGTTYACYFSLAENIFSEYPDIASLIYTFNLDVRSGPLESQTQDDKIGATVTSIIEDFLTEHPFAVLYICDWTDKREAARKRKFDLWFFKFSNSAIVKIDSVVQATDFTILGSLLVSKHHPQRDRLISVFFAITEDLNDKEFEE